MKQGSTDDPFAEAPDDGDTGEDEPADTGSETAELERESAPGTAPEDAERAGSPPSTEADESGTQRGSLPYIHARDGVKDGRTQRPVFLRDHVEAGIDDLVAEVEAELGEDVYKTDVTEAAMAVAQEHPELVREKLESWGYGWS
jgi:hypothetical protein